MSLARTIAWLACCAGLGCVREAAPPIASTNHPSWTSTGGAEATRWTTTAHGTTADLIPKHADAYVLSQRCSQGPIVVKLAALPAEYGQYFKIILHGGHAVKGRWELQLPGKVSSTFSTFASLGADGDWVKTADNARCVLSPEEKGSVPGKPGAGSGTPGTSSGGSPSGKPEGGGSLSVLVSIAMPSNLPSKFASVYYSIDGKLAGEIKLTLWSEEPNDYEGTTFVVEQGDIVPREPAKWAAGIEAEHKKAADSKVEDEERNKRRNACFNVFYSTKDHVWSEACQKEFGDAGPRAQRQQDCHNVWYAKKTWSDACRKEFGDDPGTASKTTKPSPSFSPPPAPPPDPQPPKPSVNAEWVPGSYSWEGKWVWSAGVFRVPKKDVDEGKTATAPNAPPAPKDESTKPPQPSPNSVWTGGYWFFAASNWIWIEGAWRIPPTPGATWKAFVWLKVGGSFVLDPGGWLGKP
jgi:hypothetical protein